MAITSELHITAVAALPTRHGNFKIESFRFRDMTEPHLALSMGLDENKIPVVRIHSECITGDV
ncbi:MAG: bifunctional 3,4-dihydroxy-2-butanone-4-phosphate synthase/GTP cyclohydrolase II, partial [Proteobacteria bacterium]|nr:bifunctional 3,4-dihydroxy-2-butanone-4-phosphate synthase/GTP cyclohydrolase II [Pseudomonadota bacterium]